MQPMLRNPLIKQDLEIFVSAFKFNPECCKYISQNFELVKLQLKIPDKVEIVSLSVLEFYFKIWYSIFMSSSSPSKHMHNSVPVHLFPHAERLLVVM